MGIVRDPRKREFVSGGHLERPRRGSSRARLGERRGSGKVGRKENILARKQWCDPNLRKLGQSGDTGQRVCRRMENK